MSDVLVDWAMQPMGLIFLLLLLCLIGGILRIRTHRTHFFLLLITTLTFWVCSAPVIANALVLHLEQRRANPDFCTLNEAPDVIVVPSGGLDSYVESDSPYEILDRDSLLRINRAVDIAADGSRFVILGGASHSRKPAPLMQQVLEHRGISADRIVREDISTNTRENAQALNTLLPAAQSPRITLVTSALHVPRAAGSFEHIGYEVCHVSADSQYSPAVAPVSLLPYLAGMSKTTLALHELLGLWVYRLRGYL